MLIKTFSASLYGFEYLKISIYIYAYMDMQSIGFHHGHSSTLWFFTINLNFSLFLFFFSFLFLFWLLAEKWFYTSGRPIPIPKSLVYTKGIAFPFSGYRFILLQLLVLPIFRLACRFFLACSAHYTPAFLSAINFAYVMHITFYLSLLVVFIATLLHWLLSVRMF